jgi:hypothetical protein
VTNINGARLGCCVLKGGRGLDCPVKFPVNERGGDFFHSFFSEAGESNLGWFLVLTLLNGAVDFGRKNNGIE